MNRFYTKSMKNPWIRHVQQTRKHLKISTFKEALSVAQHTYVKVQERNQTNTTETKGGTIAQRTRRRNTRRRIAQIKQKPTRATRVSKRTFIERYANDDSKEAILAKASILSSLPNYKTLIETMRQEVRDKEHVYWARGKFSNTQKNWKQISDFLAYKRENEELFSTTTTNNQTLPLCEKQVSSEYIFDALFSCDHIFMMYSGRPSSSRKENRTRGRLRGFALVQEKDSSMYLDVLCGSGNTKTIVQKIEDFARESGKPYVELFSLAHVIGYYLYLGFIPIPDSGTYEVNVEILKEIGVDGTMRKKYDLRKWIAKRINKQKISEDKKKREHPDACIKKDGTYDVHICGINGYRMIKSVNRSKGP